MALVVQVQGPQGVWLGALQTGAMAAVVVAVVVAVVAVVVAVETEYREMLFRLETERSA